MSLSLSPPPCFSILHPVSSPPAPHPPFAPPPTSARRAGLVSVILNDGRHFLGILKGFDMNYNMVLESCQERVYSPDAAVQELDLGAHLIRGDMICLVGRVDLEVDAMIDKRKLRGEPLPPIFNRG